MVILLVIQSCFYSFFKWAELQSPVNRTPDDQELGATVHAKLR